MNEQPIFPGSQNLREQRIGQQSYDKTSQSERRLWATVLLAIAHDLCASHVTFRERQDAERWIGAFPSSDFRMVVSLAGFDPQATWDRLSAMAALPYEDRIWVRDTATQFRSKRRKALNNKERAA